MKGLHDQMRQLHCQKGKLQHEKRAVWPEERRSHRRRSPLHGIAKRSPVDRKEVRDVRGTVPCQTPRSLQMHERLTPE